MVGNSCAVCGCGNTAKHDKKSFFRFPAILTNRGTEMKAITTRRRKEWFRKIKRRQDLQELYKDHDYTYTNGYLRVCSDHFISGKPAEAHDVNHPDWVPSQNLGHSSSINPAGQSALMRHERATKRNKNKILLAKDTSSNMRAIKRRFILPDDDMCATEMCFTTLSTHAATQTEAMLLQNITHTGSQTDETADLEKVQYELHSCFVEIRNLKAKLGAVTLDESSFSGNDHKITFYTGLPNNNVFMALVKHFESYLCVSLNSRLTTFQQLLLTCMSLRLNLSHEDLAYRFQVSQSTIRRVLSTCIDLLYAKLKPCIVWPSREELQKTMPQTFRNVFGKSVSVIIDCFEIFTERPSKMLAREQTWSSHKHHNTVKYLIGICPQGSITFISDGWGGHVSDKHLTNNSGLLDLLLPGDVVLAGRGFDIHKVGFHCAEVKISSCEEGKKLCPADSKSSRDASKLQIHVDRVIGLLRRKYTILNSTVSVNMLACDDDDKPKMDKIVTVCCALTNLCPSVVPLV